MQHDSRLAAMWRRMRRSTLRCVTKTKLAILGAMVAVLFVAICSVRSRETIAREMIPRAYLPGTIIWSTDVDEWAGLPENTNFLGVPDDQAVREAISTDPPIKVVVMTKVTRTSMPSDDPVSSVPRSGPTQRVGQYFYYADTSTRAYVFPGSTRENPNIIRYKKTKRFVAYDRTLDEKQAIAEKKTATLSALYKAYSRADARREVMRSLALGDRRLVGVMGVGQLVPSSTGVVAPNIVARLGEKTIPWTNDFYRSREEAEFNAVAQQFARGYNDILLAELGL